MTSFFFGELEVLNLVQSGTQPLEIPICSIGTARAVIQRKEQFFHTAVDYMCKI